MMIRPAMREYRTWGIDSTGWDAYAPRPGDIIIATAPKCGTTWMQQIVSSLVFRDATVHALPTVSPWLDARVGRRRRDAQGACDADPPPFSEIAPADRWPASLYDEVRYIHVARDGRDAFMSMHNHFTGYSEAQLASFDRIGLADPAIARPYPRPPTDPAPEYFRLWRMSTRSGCGPNGWHSRSIVFRHRDRLLGRATARQFPAGPLQRSCRGSRSRDATHCRVPGDRDRRNRMAGFGARRRLRGNACRRRCTGAVHDGIVRRGIASVLQQGDQRALARRPDGARSRAL